MSAQTILVIGASGFIGRHSVKHLTALGCTVYATYLPGETVSSVPGVNRIVCDVTSADFVDALPARCDALIYLAQSPEWRVFPEGAPSVLQINVVAALQAARYALQAGAQSFIYASTGSVYTQVTQPARETELFDLQTSRNFYTASKLATELLLQPYVDLFRVILLRLFVPYGVGLHPSMLMSRLVEKVRQHKPISLHGQHGMTINPTAVTDVAEALARCLSCFRSTTLNIAGPQVLTLREVGETIGKIVGKKPHFETHPKQTPPMLVGDTRNLRQTLNWVPMISLEQGLRMWLDK